jgi:hypothetical protein
MGYRLTQDQEYKFEFNLEENKTYFRKSISASSDWTLWWILANIWTHRS